MVRNEGFIQACGNIWLTCLGGRRSSQELGEALKSWEKLSRAKEKPREREEGLKMEASSWVKVLSMAGGENWKRNLNHAAHQAWISEDDKKELERLRRSNDLAGQSLQKQARAMDHLMACWKAKGERRWGSKEEIEKHLSQQKEEKDRRHKEEKDRRHKEETDRRGELKRKREALEREEQELKEEEEKERQKLREEEEKESKKLMKWENARMEEEALQTTLWLLDEEMAADKQRSKKMKQEKAERLQEKEEKGHSSLDQLVQTFRDSWDALCDVEITGLKVKMRNRERSKNYYCKEKS